MKVHIFIHRKSKFSLKWCLTKTWPFIGHPKSSKSATPLPNPSCWTTKNSEPYCKGTLSTKSGKSHHLQRNKRRFYIWLEMARQRSKFKMQMRPPASLQTTRDKKSYKKWELVPNGTLSLRDLIHSPTKLTKVDSIIFYQLSSWDV